MRAILSTAPRRQGLAKRFYSSAHHNSEHDEHHHGTPASNSTGWPKPSGRSPVRPFERDQVSSQLSTITPGKQPEEIKELEGWLFGKKVLYLNSEQPFYEQIPDHHKYAFGERVCFFLRFKIIYIFLASPTRPQTLYG